MDSDFRNTIVSMPQFRNRLEDRRGEKNKGRSRKEIREERTGKKGEKRKNNRGQESSRRVGNLEWRRGGSKIWGRDKEASPRKVPLID